MLSGISDFNPIRIADWRDVVNPVPDKPLFTVCYSQVLQEHWHTLDLRDRRTQETASATNTKYGTNLEFTNSS